MSKYESITRWRDLEDGHLYNPGDAYPYNGKEVSESRINELISTQNKAGFAVIKAVEEKAEEIPVQAKKTPRKAVRSRKKTA